MRGRYGVAENAGHTVAAGWTNIPGLELEKVPASRRRPGGPTEGLYAGLSPSQRNAATPKLPSLAAEAPNREIKSEAPNPGNRHAEEDLLNRVHEAIKAAIENGTLKVKDLDGKTLWIHISRPDGVCDICMGGLGNSLQDNLPPGVLKQFSEKYPTLRVVVTAEGGVASPGIRDGDSFKGRHEVLRILDGKVVE